MIAKIFEKYSEFKALIKLACMPGGEGGDNEAFKNRLARNIVYEEQTCDMEFFDEFDSNNSSCSAKLGKPLF